MYIYTHDTHIHILPYPIIAYHVYSYMIHCYSCHLIRCSIDPSLVSSRTVQHDISHDIIPVSEQRKQSSGENNMWEDEPSECQVRG